MSCSSNIIFLEYTWYWVEKVNHGGVIYVTDDFYKFIRKIKYTVREILNMKLIVAYAGENLRNILLEKLKENKNLSEDWDWLINRLIKKDFAEKIKVKIFITWINMRGNSFVKTWISIVRCEVSYENRASSYSNSGQKWERLSVEELFPCYAGIVTVYTDKDGGRGVLYNWVVLMKSL